MLRLFIPVMFLSLLGASARAQQTYFIDGYHGGIYGHYPEWNTRFMADQLQANPYWKINLEIEPVTWDDAKQKDPAAYQVFRSLFADQSARGRIEYVNPSYGQSYLFNISGESIIRQFSYGIKKVKAHFPTAVFSTYSSEEPCFTSALPQLLRSFGFRYASLKNPNTCWGGYTRAFGGELVNWEGPDGTLLPAVPRYAVEALEPGSTWQTIAWNNSAAYLDAAFRAGIRHPIGMCLQDAGWKNGPWLKKAAYKGTPVQYETWRHYFENIADTLQAPRWRLTQEDIQVSLVWGAQVLQRIAAQVRSTENSLVAAEKLAAIARVYSGFSWPKSRFDTAWEALLLAQHHDCWIVPYNGEPGDTWADKVAAWTATADSCSGRTARQAMHCLVQGREKQGSRYVGVFNTTATDRTEWVRADFPAGWASPGVTVLDSRGRSAPSQLVQRTGGSAVLFRATVPSMGYSIYRLQESAAAPAAAGATVTRLPGGGYLLETDHYRMALDPARGGVISSLVAKKLHNREFVDQRHERGFNEIRGYFYEEGVFHSSMDSAAVINVLESGPGRVQVQVSGHIGIHPFSQFITLAQGQPRIDLQVKISWKGSPGIGEFSQAMSYRNEDPRKAFYNDRFKLQALFPLNLQQQRISKDAPFDVTESRLQDTYFGSWDSIRNNIILHWVDVTGNENSMGLALLTDHTTSYAHGPGDPLGLTLQYAGKGLWGRNYDITGPTEIKYALVPHAGAWAEGQVWRESAAWCEPLLVAPAGNEAPAIAGSRSLVALEGPGWEATALMVEGNDLLLRLFNAAGDARKGRLRFNVRADSILLEELDGRKIKALPALRTGKHETTVELSLPRFGIRTLRLVNAASLKNNNITGRK